MFSKANDRYLWLRFWLCGDVIMRLSEITSGIEIHEEKILLQGTRSKVRYLAANRETTAASSALCRFHSTMLLRSSTKLTSLGASLSSVVPPTSNAEPTRTQIKKDNHLNERFGKLQVGLAYEAQKFSKM